MDYTLINAYHESYYYTRFPIDIINKLGYMGHNGGQEKAYDMAGVEIRYLSDQNKFLIDLEIEGEGFLSLYIGDFSIKQINLHNGLNEIREVVHDRFIELNPKGKTYPSNLFRIRLEPGYKLSKITLHDKSAKKYNSNLKTCVYYGSSFTEGAGSLSNAYSYANLSTTFLKVDSYNKGLSGNCLCEETTCDYLATLNPDFYILELGCNMRGYMDEDEFYKRVDYLFNSLKGKKVFVISSLTFFVKQFKMFGDKAPYQEKNISFSKILEKLANKYNFVLINMTDLMTELSDVSYDMLHPSQIGHLKIAYNLYLKIKDRI